VRHLNDRRHLFILVGSTLIKKREGRNVTSIKSGSHVLPDSAADQGDATGVSLDESTDIMNDASDEDERSSLRLFLELFEFHDRQSVKRDSPIEFGSPLIKFLLLLLKHSFLDFVAGEFLEA